MKSPEEEADHELGRKLREKLDGFKAPVSDQVRERVFGALDKSPNRIFWIPVIGGLILIAALFLGDLVNIPTNSDTKDLSILSKNKTGNTRQIQSKTSPQTEIKVNSINQKQIKAEPVSENAVSRNTVSKDTFDRIKKKSFIQKQPIEKTTGLNTAYYTSSTSINSSATPAELAFLNPVDSVNIAVSWKALTIPPISSNAPGEAAKKPRILHGVKGIFSISALQTFQLVNLSQSSADRIQNLQFAPLFSSKSLSYKVTAGVEKKNTQLLLSYSYLRNWNEYEIGTNQIIATRVGDQYQMTRIGEKHLEDERLHLLGIGIRQRIMMPQNILKNYSMNVGMEYNRLIPQGQDLVWGNIGFYKHIYQSGETRFEVGPYFQYSFTEREVAGQIWKSRPYQVGISVHIKTK